MTATNKRLLISESRGDSNQCAPYRGKPNQHAIRFPRSVCIWSMTIHISHSPQIATFHMVVNRFEQIHCTWEEGLPTQSAVHRGWPIRGSVPSFSPTIAHGVVGKSQASVDIWLLGLLGPYHWHAIGMFNTYSRVPTHRSLIDTGGGYHLGGAGLPYTTLRPSQPAVSTFHLRAPPGLQFNQVPSIKPKCWV
jgi:hypothetical protein